MDKKSLNPGPHQSVMRRLMRHDYFPVFVMVPGIILFHWGWVKLQDMPGANEEGLTEEQMKDRKTLPIVKVGISIKCILVWFIYNKIHNYLFSGPMRR